MFNTAVHGAKPNKACQMDLGAVFVYMLNSKVECNIIKKSTIGNCIVDSQQILKNNSSRSYIYVPDLTIAYLAFRQTNCLTGSNKQGMGVGKPHVVKVSWTCARNCVAGAILSNTPTI